MSIGTAIFVSIAVDWQTKKLLDNSTRFAADMSDVIERSMRYSMLLNRREDVDQIMKTVGNEERIAGIRIYNKKGMVTYSTQESETGKNVNMSAEACTVCHAGPKPLQPDSKLLTRIFDSPKGYRMMGIITPIRNEANCSSNDCHAHDSTQTVLGILDVMIPLKDVDANIAELRQAQIVGSVFLVVVLIGFVVTFIWREVTIPVKKLAVGTLELERGNLSHRIDITNGDEIGALAASFNRMAQELQRTRMELTTWAQTLEKRVSEKTDELRRAQKHLVQIEKMVSLGTLAATVAHELNNPLEGILTYAKLLRKKIDAGIPSGEAAREMSGELGLIADETARCGNIVKNLLLFSREKVGEFKDADVRSVIEQSLKLIEHHMQIHNIKVETNLGSEPAILFCDAHQLEEALLALEINAVEAMASGGTFALAVREIGYLNSIQITLRDTGCGIHEEDIPHIFEPFYTTKKDGKGTGLGLSVVYGIIERHGGTVTVDTRVNAGTIFTITLPKHVAQQGAQTQASTKG
jgi:two-component system NtrC family sensor kinase